MADLELEKALGVESNISSDGDDIERLVFPVNVHESISASSGLKRSEKTGIIISFWVFASALLAWFLAGWLRTVVPAYYIWVVLAVELTLQATVGTLILRFAMDEGTLISEMANDNNNFSKYFGIYHEIISEDNSAYPFDVIEFVDGSYAVYIQFLLGYNTNHASAATYDVNMQIQALVNKSGMFHRILYMNEDFGNSSAADRLRKTVAGIKDPRLFSVYRDIIQGVLNTASEESNVLSMTYVIYAKTLIQKDELKQLVINILNTVRSDDTVYREVNTLSYDDIVELYRNYYKLDVLDMGLIRVHAAKRKNMSCAVKLLRVYGKNGKAYSTADMKNLQDNLLREHGLEQVN